MENDSCLGIVITIIMLIILGFTFGTMFTSSWYERDVTNDICKIVCTDVKDYLVCKGNSYGKALARIQRLKDYGR